MILLALSIALIDQISKYFTVAHIPLDTYVDFIPGVIGFTYKQNFGAAFSSLPGMSWLFVLIFVALTAFIVLEYRKQFFHLTKFEWWCIAVIYGGGLGNVIDRIRLGYVIDMIDWQFVMCGIFNIADCFVVAGCVLFVLDLIFRNKEFWETQEDNPE